MRTSLVGRPGGAKPLPRPGPSERVHWPVGSRRWSDTIRTLIRGALVGICLAVGIAAVACHDSTAPVVKTSLLITGDRLDATIVFSDSDVGEPTRRSDWGDGTRPLVIDVGETRFDICHVYSAPGDYFATVTVTDDQGLAGSAGSVSCRSSRLLPSLTP